MCVNRSDPTLQHGHGHSSATGQQLTGDRQVPSVPPSDGHGVKQGTGVIRDGSIKNLVSSYENKLQEVGHSVT